MRGRLARSGALGVLVVVLLTACAGGGGGVSQNPGLAIGSLSLEEVRLYSRC
jgi:hypothetical protein